MLEVADFNLNEKQKSDLNTMLILILRNLEL